MLVEESKFIKLSFWILFNDNLQRLRTNYGYPDKNYLRQSIKEDPAAKDILPDDYV